MLVAGICAVGALLAVWARWHAPAAVAAREQYALTIEAWRRVETGMDEPEAVRLLTPGAWRLRHCQLTSVSQRAFYYGAPSAPTAVLKISSVGPAGQAVVNSKTILRDYTLYGMEGCAEATPEG